MLYYLVSPLTLGLVTYPTYLHTLLKTCLPFPTYLPTLPYIHTLPILHVPTLTTYPLTYPIYLRYLLEWCLNLNNLVNPEFEFVNDFVFQKYFTKSTYRVYKLGRYCVLDIS